MPTVMALDFLDNEGVEHRLPLMSPEAVGRFHYARNRKAYGTDMFCISCKAPAHLVEHRGRKLMYVAHRPGHGSGACAYSAFFQAAPPGMSIEHRMASAVIAESIDALNHWTASVEHTIQTDAGKRRLDVYAWRDQQLKPWHNPKVHEVQLSRQGLHETVLRTAEHRQALPSSSTIWWTPDKASITGELGLLGLVTDESASHIADRAYSELEPELVPARPTIREAARSLARDTKPWALIPWRDEDTDEHCQILVPIAATSGVLPRRALRSTVRGESDRVIEVGCEREPVTYTQDGLGLSPGTTPTSTSPAPTDCYQLPDRPQIERASRQEHARSDCPSCGENMPTFTMDVHNALIHPGQNV